MNLKEEYEKNKHLVGLKSTPDPGLFVLKYKRKCFYDGIWNDFIENARGTIVDKDFNIVSLPFTKIYNYGIEERAPVYDDLTMLMYVEKVNGFMAAITSHNGKMLISTTGSIDSDFVGYVRQYVEPYSVDFELFFAKNFEHTYLFECVHPDDPHIVEEKFGLHFLGKRLKKLGSAVEMETDEELQFFDKVGVHVPDTGLGFIDDIKEKVKKTTKEGFVIYGVFDETSTKIKSPHYLVKKLFMRGNIQKLLAGKAREYVDEEYFPLISHIESCKEHFESLTEFERRSFLEEYFAANLV